MNHKLGNGGCPRRLNIYPVMTWFCIHKARSRFFKKRGVDNSKVQRLGLMSMQLMCYLYAISRTVPSNRYGLYRVQRVLRGGAGLGITTVIDGYLMPGATYWIICYHDCILMEIDYIDSMYIQNSGRVIRLVYFPVRLYSILWKWLFNII